MQSHDIRPEPRNPTTDQRPPPSPPHQTPKGQTEDKTAAALDALFARASDFAPCLLTLRHVSDLVSGGPGAPAPSPLGISKVADALTGAIDRYCSCAARRRVLLPPAAGSSNAGGGGKGGGSGAQQEASKQGQLPPGLVIVVGCTASLDEVPSELSRCFTHDIEVGMVEREQYGPLLESLLAPLHSNGMGRKQLPTSATAAGDTIAADGSDSTAAACGSGGEHEGIKDEAVAAAAAQMVGLLPRDVLGVVADALADAAAAEGTEEDEAEAALDQQHNATTTSVPEAATSSSAAAAAAARPPLPRIAASHLESAVGRIKARTAVEIGAPQVPDVRWEDVGGLEDVKAAILDTVELPLRHRCAGWGARVCMCGVEGECVLVCAGWGVWMVMVVALSVLTFSWFDLHRSATH